MLQEGGVPGGDKLPEELDAQCRQYAQLGIALKADMQRLEELRALSFSCEGEQFLELVDHQQPALEGPASQPGQLGADGRRALTHAAHYRADLLVAF
ncbi:hypothetical protein N566_16070 [Streptomycetaceae bacterium MP113-05]|nr:hypothetical protein N566_16070 [Streptomycetaceae bacterium MP113-05]